MRIFEAVRKTKYVKLGGHTEACTNVSPVPIISFISLSDISRKIKIGSKLKKFIDRT